jgi:hypothetical protein
LSNYEAAGEDFFGEGASASGLEAYEFPAISDKGTMEKKISHGQKQELSSQSSIQGQKSKASQVSRIEPAIPIKRVKKQTKISMDQAEVRETFGKADVLDKHHMVKIRAFNMGSSTSKGDLITTIKVDVTLMKEPTVEERARETDESWVDHLVYVFKTHASMFVALSKDLNHQTSSMPTGKMSIVTG